MRLPWQRKAPTPVQRLLTAAGADPREAAGAPPNRVAARVAYQVAHRDDPATARVLAVIEELTADEAAYEVVIAALEALQNVVSHRDDRVLLPEEVEALLGPRSTACWAMIAAFWSAVADWARENLPPLKSSEAIRAVENARLRQLVWTSNRTLPAGEQLGLAEVVRYEIAGGKPMLGFEHIGSALEMMENLGTPG